ncbi:MAG: response regulator [Lachnospiraceae bacterium]|nr:response regulator [Lachnospiraceae bacterium]
MKLLVADDEDTIRKGVVKYIKLHSNRFDKIYEAENGQETIDVILTYQPEIVLLDVQMPLITGIEVMREITKAGLNPVIIILSGYDDFKYAQQAIKYGAKEYLLKPIRANDILECVEKWANKLFGDVDKDVNVDEEASTNHFIRETCDYISEHYMEDISLSYMADYLGISSGYLSTLFAQNVKCGFVDYLNQVRIGRACSYLEQNYLKTYEVAYKVGFRDEKYFSKVFKKMMGMSPREYRVSRH